ncbi:MAG: pseudouridine synthase [Betaproteobacteria bacterium]
MNTKTKTPFRRPVVAAVSTESHKLQKVLAQIGLGSRRDMEVWIEEERVLVNGQIATKGTRVTSSDRIKVDGRDVHVSATAVTPRVLLYHKPEGEIVTRDDPQGRETVFSNLPGLRGARWLSVGRLDVSTSGLLIFTTSGELANSMMHPRFKVEREYAARVFGTLNQTQADQLCQGIELPDGMAAFNALTDEGGEGSNHWYRVQVSEGRNRLVRRLFEALGFTVSRLIRVRFGYLQLPSRLKRGQFMELEPAEVIELLAWLKQPLIETEDDIQRAKPAKRPSRVSTKTQSSPPLVKGQKNAMRGQARSTRDRA